MVDKVLPSQPHNLQPARVIQLADFDDARALFSNWQGRFEQLTCGPFAGLLRIVRGQLVRLVSVEANQRILIRGRDAAGLFSVYPVGAKNSASLWQGRQLAEGQLVLHGREVQTDHLSARQTHHLGMSLSTETMEAAVRSLRNTDVSGLSGTWSVFSPPPDAFAPFCRQCNRLLNTGLADASSLGTSESRLLEQECLRSLVASLFTTSASQSKVSLPVRSKLISHAEDLMRCRLADPLGAIDLCREVGASDRTLRLAFRERYGLGPMTYYKSLRLNAVRSTLKRNPLMTVAEAARAFGFYHLGNFAADYRRLFGEHPSTTGKRSQLLPPSRPTN